MLTKEQKWMNRLKRCLKDMPDGYEVLVTSWDFQSSAVSLIPQGEYTDYITDDENAVRTCGSDTWSVDSCGYDVPQEYSMVVDKVLIREG